MAMTWHLTTWNEWQEQQGEEHYQPGAFAADGYIHCTDGRERLMETGNRHYQRDDSQFLAVEIDLDALASPWVYEDEKKVFPHIYGPLNRSAVVSVREVVRTQGGRFLRTCRAVHD